MSVLRQISHYDVASTTKAAYIISGKISNGNTAASIKGSNIIAKFANNKWSIHALLSKARMFHKSLTHQSQVMIFGGYFHGYR